MDEIFNKIKEEAQDIKLEANDKERIGMNLRSFMLYYPVKSAAMPIESTWYGEIWRVASIYKFVPATLALLLIVGSSVSAAASKALPGDLLYPIKIGINERARLFLASDAQEEAKIHTELVTKRLNEIAELKAEGKLDAKTEANIVNEANNEVKEAQSVILEIRTSGDEKAAITAEVELEAAIKAGIKIEDTNADTDSKIESESNESVEIIIPLATSSSQGMIEVIP